MIWWVIVSFSAPRARRADLAGEPLGDLVGPVVRLQQQEAQHRDPQVALGLGPAAAEPGLAQHVDASARTPRRTTRSASSRRDEHAARARATRGSPRTRPAWRAARSATRRRAGSARAWSRRERHALVEHALVALERQVAHLQLAVGAEPGPHLGDVRVDVLVAQRAGDGHAVVAVADEVQVADPEDVDRRHRLAALARLGDPLPAPARARRRAEVAVELAAPAVDGADDRVERDHLLADVERGSSRRARPRPRRTGSMCETSSGSKRSRDASRDRTRRRRSRSKAIFASSRGCPVLIVGSSPSYVPSRHGGRDPLRRAGFGQDDAVPRPLPRDARAGLAGPAAHPRAARRRSCASCLETRMPFVVDNTNPTVGRARALRGAGARGGLRVVAYLVEVDHAVAAARNAARERIVPAALRDVARRLVRPTPEEGFDELLHATAAPDGGWRDRAAAHDTAAVLSASSIARQRVVGELHVRGRDVLAHLLGPASRRRSRRSRSAGAAPTRARAGTA